jgi:hypothetical protein
MTEMCDECGFLAVAPGDCDEEPRDCLSTAVEMSSLPGTSDAQFFRARGVVPVIPNRTETLVDPPMIQFVSLEMEKQSAGPAIALLILCKKHPTQSLK